MDHKHKVAACLHFKVGSSTWRLIFANNSDKGPIPTRRLKTIFNEMRFFEHYNIYELSHARHSPDDIRNVLKNYYKFMVVRHPLHRLTSTYADKFKKENRWFAKLHGFKIVRKYRPHADRKLKRTGQGINFEDLLKYIKDGATDGHWQGPFNDWCQPCMIKYDKIVRIETHDHDSADIVNEHLAGRGSMTRANPLQTKGSSHTSVLPEYTTVNDTLLNAILKIYSLDFTQFGYHYKRHTDGTVVTDCGISTAAGDDCC